MPAATEAPVWCGSIPDIEHVRGNLFRVKLDSLVTADEEISKEEGSEAVFRNPRGMILFQGGKMSQVNGLGKQDMDEKRENIRIDGLNHPLTCRWVFADNHDKWVDPDDYEEGADPLARVRVQVVNGDLRLRCLKKLVADKAMCKDHSTGDVAPADQVYEYVLCRILPMDTETAYRYAYQGNDKSSPMGDAADVANVRQWRTWGWSDKQILTLTGKSITWLREMDQLCALDETTFKALAERQINKQVAKALGQLDEKERLERLEFVKEVAQKRAANAKAKIRAELDRAKEQVELAQAQAADAEYLGDRTQREEATEKLGEVAEKLEEAETKIDKIDATPPTATTRDLNVTNQQDDIPKKLTEAKLRKGWLAKLDEFIGSQRKKGAEPLDGIDLEDCRFAEMLVKAILADSKEQDIEKILKRHFRDKERRAK